MVVINQEVNQILLQMVRLRLLVGVLVVVVVVPGELVVVVIVDGDVVCTVAVTIVV